MQKNLEKYKNQFFNVSTIDTYESSQKKYSLRFACNIELNYSSNNGLNLKVLKIDDFEKPKKSYSYPVFKKGGNINIYC